MQGVIYKHHFLINAMYQGKLKTFAASCQRIPEINETATVYIFEMDDYLKIAQSDIIANLLHKDLFPRCKVCSRIIEEEAHYCTAFDCEHLNPVLWVTIN